MVGKEPTFAALIAYLIQITTFEEVILTGKIHWWSTDMATGCMVAGNLMVQKSKQYQL